jgi:hypothetical protein
VAIAELGSEVRSAPASASAPGARAPRAVASPADVRLALRFASSALACFALLEAAADCVVEALPVALDDADADAVVLSEAVAEPRGEPEDGGVPERLDDVRHRPRNATFCELMKHGLGLDILACPCGHRMLCLWFAAHRRERRRDPLRREAPRPSAPRQGLA